MNHPPEYTVVLASDKQLFFRVERLLQEKQPVIIRVDSTFRHTKGFIRYLKFSYEGARDVGRWRFMFAVFHSGHIAACLGLREDYNYSWHYEYTDEGVDLFLDPPNDAETA